jgi:hypothetical protein
MIDRPDPHGYFNPEPWNGSEISTPHPAPAPASGRWDSVVIRLLRATRHAGQFNFAAAL